MANIDFDYSSCLFEARLNKSHFLSKNQSFYLYVSPNKIIVNTEPYSKRPSIVLELLPTTHVKWLWENKRNKIGQNKLKGFIIETEGHMYQFVAECVVLQMLKANFKEITLQSDFYDEYSLGKYIDKGNYAQVYECTRKNNNNRHAVKILEKERLKTMKNGKESVFNELRILRSLKHCNLMRLFEVFEDRNKYYFVLELLTGTTLYKEIQQRKKKKEFTPRQIRGIIKQILEGINYLNKNGIMHRDVKPQNILFQEKDSLDKLDRMEKGSTLQGLKLVDYGLATYQNQPHVIFTKCGTPGFVAPQVITFDQQAPLYGLNVDIFSVGVILHILLIGEQSFPGKSRNTILNKNKQCKLDFKSDKYKAIQSDGIDLLSRMLEKNPEKRITPAEALQHPFFMHDKPIFKFRKDYRIEGEGYQNLHMKVYHNLEQLQLEEEINSPIKIRPVSMGSRSSHPGFVDRYYNQLTYYDPFGYETVISGQSLKQLLPIRKERRDGQSLLLFKHISINNQQEQEYMNEQAQSLLNYEL